MLMKSVKLREIAAYLNAELVGDEDAEITGMNGILEASNGDITFLANPKYADKLPLCRAAAVIVDKDVTAPGKNLIRIENPRLAFAKLIRLMVPEKKESGLISESAHVSFSSQVGKQATIYPGVFIGENVVIGCNSILYPGTFVGDNVKIGDNCKIYANVTINYNCIIGNNVILNSNCVIGSEGFGYEREGERHYKIPQVGGVIIEDDVEIGALCAVDRGTVKETIIGRCTKLDNLVHVAHNCQVGENNLLLGHSALAGTVKTGKNVYFGGHSGSLDHVTITDHVQIGSLSVVTNNIEEKGLYFGYPARPQPDWQKGSAMFYKTDDLRKKVIALEKKTKELDDKLNKP